MESQAVENMNSRRHLPRLDLGLIRPDSASRTKRSMDNGHGYLDRSCFWALHVLATVVLVTRAGKATTLNVANKVAVRPNTTVRLK